MPSAKYHVPPAQSSTHAASTTSIATLLLPSRRCLLPSLAVISSPPVKVQHPQPQRQRYQVHLRARLCHRRQSPTWPALAARHRFRASPHFSPPPPPPPPPPPIVLVLVGPARVCGRVLPSWAMASLGSRERLGGWQNEFESRGEMRRDETRLGARSSLPPIGSLRAEARCRPVILPSGGACVCLRPIPNAIGHIHMRDLPSRHRDTAAHTSCRPWPSETLLASTPRMLQWKIAGPGGPSPSHAGVPPRMYAAASCVAAGTSDATARYY